VALPHPTSRPFIRQRASGPFWYAKWSRNGTPVIRSLGRAWVDPDGRGGWRRRRARAPEGTLTEAEAGARMLELVRAHDEEQQSAEADAEERRRRGVTFRVLAAEWIVYLEREKGAKPSTLRDYRWLLAEPGQPHQRGDGAAPGVMMAALGDRQAKDVTTRTVADYLRSLDRRGASPRTVNKHRQVISAMFAFGMREDTYRLSTNPASGTNKRREPPPAVLDFYEPDEVEAIARAATAGAHRNVTRLHLRPEEIAARTFEDKQDAELIRIAAFTGLRLGELLALRWADVNLVGRRLVVHRAFSGRIEGPTKSWQSRFVPIADPAATAFARLSERDEFFRADDYVFCSRLGRPLDGSALRRRFKAAAAASGLRVLRFHALRHSAGSMVARHTDARWVQGFLGHSKLATTERYLHAKARPQDVELLNRAFALGDEGAVTTLPSGTLEAWDRAVNEDPLPNAEPNRTVLVGADGRPATREELIEFVRENNARVARESEGGE
jgi:integrase